MIFVYNAIMDGWTVRMLKDGTFEFKQKRACVKYDVELEDYVKKFIKENMNGCYIK